MCIAQQVSCRRITLNSLHVTMQPLVAARTCLLPATVPRPILQVDADVHDLYRSWCGDDVICVWRKSAFNRTIQHGALHWCARGLNPGTHAVKYDGVARPSKCRAVRQLCADAQTDGCAGGSALRFAIILHQPLRQVSGWSGPDWCPM